MECAVEAEPSTPFYSPREEITSPLASTSRQQQLSSPTKTTAASPSSPIGSPANDQTTPNGKGKRTPGASPPIVKRPSLSSRRTRSGSVGLLRRFTSRGSTLASDDTHGDVDRAPMETPGRIDREALSRPKGKYKSGIRLDNNTLILQGGNEQDAWLDSGFVQEAQADQNAVDEEQAKLALATGGTAAAKAYWLNNGYGRTIFPAEERAREEAAMRATMAAQATSQRQFPSTPLRYSPTKQMDSSQHRSSGQPLRPPPVQAMPSQDSSNSGSRLSAAPGSQTSSTSQLAGIDWAQRAAIKPATATSSGLQSPATSMTAGQQRSPSSPLQQSTSDADQEVQKSPAASSIRSKRRTFLGLGSKSTDKLEKLSGSRRNGTDVEVKEETTPRRRYPNTKELDLLAAELNNEASWERQIHSLNIQHGQWAQSPSGSQTPADSAVGSSFHGRALNGGGGGSSSSAGLAISNGEASAYSSPSSVSLATMPNGFQPFTAPFAQKHRSASPASSIPSSPMSPPFDLSGAVGARFAAGSIKGSSTAAPLLSTTQKNELGETPHEMFVGLDSGPYPLLPADAMPDGGASGYTTPRKGRLGSESGGHAGSITGLKSSVLSMSLHNPETESQGLIKPVKSSRATPWGSRAPSRTVTPKTSGKDLKELAKQQAAATQLPKSRRGSLTQVASGGSGRRRPSGESAMANATNGPVVPTPVLEDPVVLSRPAPVLQEQQSPRSRSATPDRSAQQDVAKASSKPARHSIMGVFNKSRENVGGPVKESIGKARRGEDDEAQASLAKLVPSTQQATGQRSISQASPQDRSESKEAANALGLSANPSMDQNTAKPSTLKTAEKNGDASSPRRNFSPARLFQQQQARPSEAASNVPRAANGSVSSTPTKQQRGSMVISPTSTTRSTTTTLQSGASPIGQKRPGGLKRLFSSFKSSPKKASSAASAPPSPAVARGAQDATTAVSPTTSKARLAQRPIVTANPASSAGAQQRRQSPSKSPAANQATQPIPAYPNNADPTQQAAATGNGHHQDLASRHESSVDGTTQDLANSYEADAAWSSSTAGSTSGVGQSSAEYYNLMKGGTVKNGSDGTVRAPLPLDFSRGNREREVVNV